MPRNVPYSRIASVAALKAAALAVLLCAGSALAHESEAGGVPLPKPNFAGKGERCVEDTEFMRRNHMELILHQRDETMHEGIRTKQHSLKNCINCHASPETNSVLGENGFCVSCHSYASVKIDCFSCHSDKPEPGSKAATAQPVDPRAEQALGGDLSLIPAAHAGVADGPSGHAAGSAN
jgi:hypothetical protein